MGRHSSDHAVPHKVPPLFQEQTGGTEEVEGREVVGDDRTNGRIENWFYRSLKTMASVWCLLKALEKAVLDKIDLQIICISNDCSQSTTL